MRRCSRKNHIDWCACYMLLKGAQREGCLAILILHNLISAFWSSDECRRFHKDTNSETQRSISTSSTKWGVHSQSHWTALHSNLVVKCCWHSWRHGRCTTIDNGTEGMMLIISHQHAQLQVAKKPGHPRHCSFIVETIWLKLASTPYTFIHALLQSWPSDRCLQDRRWRARKKLHSDHYEVKQKTRIHWV